MKPFGALMPFEEAKKIVEDNIKPISRVEIITLDDCLGRVLAENIEATLTIPSFDRAAMDGYAVKTENTSNASRSHPGVLRLIGKFGAGEIPPGEVHSGECIQIATGAIIPQGADAVVKVEDTRSDGGKIEVLGPVRPGENISQRGEDVKQGELILKQGFVLDPAKVGVLASQGINHLRVYEKPKVAVLPTGEEVAEVGEKLGEGQVYNINAYTISSVVKANGGIPTRFKITGDKSSAIKLAITEGLKNDMVVISGGSSVGEKDLLLDILQNLGEVLFHGVRIKPGMPILFGRVDGKPVFGMPGFPTSCLFTTHIFVAPSIRTMAHLPFKREEMVKARLSKGIPSSPGRRQFFTVRLEGDTAIPVYKESGAITSMSRADGYIEIAENIDWLDKGEPVTVRLF